MSLAPGTRLGPYHVTAQIGAGGMGEVYRATDTNLKRQVALKVLPDALASDSDRLARFQREAEILAALNHPNIATVHGLERGDPSTGSGQARVLALVMEFVEGPTLADRLADGPIPVPEALVIAQQMAEALEAAHERGIIHRDLKPANVKVRPDGAVKVLDFGLAKAMDSDNSGSSRYAGVPLSLSPTITTPAMTQAGMILGTAAYMSPEQARGKRADRRSDVWAFGAVLYEMLTGRRAFDGEDMVDVLGAVTRIDPDWSAIPTSVPAPVTTLLKACLVKDPRHRLGGMDSVLFVLSHLESLAPAASSPGVTPVSRTSLLWVAVAASLFGAIAMGAGVWLARGPAALAPVTRATITLSGNLQLSGEGVALSPDGRTLVIPAANHLVVRALDRDQFTALPGTEGATTPFFSPDGEWVGFVANMDLRKVRVDGSTPTTIARAVGFVSGKPSWSTNEAIVYGVVGDGLFRVPAAGGVPERLTEPRHDANEIGHSDPQLLPDARALLFNVMSADGGVGAILDLDTHQWRTLPGIGANATFVKGGYLAFTKGKTLLVSRFDPATGLTSGSTAPVLDDVGSSFAVAPNGTLAFRASEDTNNLLTVRGSIMVADRSGKTTAVLPEAPVTMEAGGGLSFHPRDASRFLATLRDDRNAPAHIWLYDLSRPGTRARLTSQGFINAWPIWDFEGGRFAFTSLRNPMGIYVQSPDPGAATTLLLARRTAVENPQAWAADGSLVLLRMNDGTGADITVLDPSGNTSDVVVTSASEMSPQVSRDGQWLAYQSDASGQLEVYVRPFRGQGTTEIISRGGGVQPRWAGANELLYRRGKKVVSVMMAASDGRLKPAPERELFEVDDHSQHYDVSTDGTKFLFLRREAQTAGAPPGQVQLVLNWPEDLKRLVP